MNTQNKEKKMEFDATAHLTDIKGKQYLEAKWRLVWFREVHPNWSIETEIVERIAGGALMRATVKDENGKVMAQAHKMETKAGFADYLEKAETGAIARALAMCGFGTQFAEEFEEGTERIADAPVAKPAKSMEQAQKDMGGKVIETTKTAQTTERTSTPGQQKAIFAIARSNGHSKEDVAAILGHPIAHWTDITFQEASDYIDKYGQKGIENVEQFATPKAAVANEDRALFDKENDEIPF